LHYLLFDPVMGKSGKLDAVIRALNDGTPSADAMRQAYGDFEPIEGAYMQHVRKELMPYVRLKTETKVVASAFSSRALTDPESANARASLHSAMGRPAEARALIAEARKTGEAAAGYEVEAMLADRDDNAAALKAALTKAEQLGTTNFYALYRLALLDLPQSPDAAASAVAEARLRKAVELNPFHASAHAMLGNVLANGPAEKRAQAIPAAQAAVKLAPGDAFANRVLALALWNVGQRDAALARARLSLTLADNDGQRRQSQQLLDFFAKNAAAR
jgi:tetratricopeptide (TPR) repeat protein